MFATKLAAERIVMVRIVGWLVGFVFVFLLVGAFAPGLLDIFFEVLGELL
jgi:hypothetical protein